MKINSLTLRKWLKALISLCIIFGLDYSYWKYKKAYDIFYAGKLTQGHVVEVFNAFNLRTGFKYYFYYSGKRYEGMDFYENVNWSIKDSIYFKPVPVLFMPDNPSENRVLLN